MKRLTVILLLFFLPSSIFGSRSIVRKHLSFYYGKTYRFNKTFYNSFDISCEKYYSNCRYGDFRGWGLRVDNFNNNSSISIKYFRTFIKHPGGLLIPYLGLSPVFFRFKNSSGINIKPEIGLRFNTSSMTRRQPISLSINLSYGYDIPIFNKEMFKVGRNDISAKAAMTLNLKEIKDYFKREKNSIPNGKD